MIKKNITQDIVPPKKTIRDVELPSRSRDEAKKASKFTTREDPFTRPVSIHTPKNTQTVHDEPIRIDRAEKVEETPTDNYKYEYHEPKKTGKKFIFIFAGVAVLALAFGVSAMFKSATITVSPLVQTKTLDESFTAKKDIGSNSLNFQVVTVTKDLEKAIDPKDITSEQKVERKAKGTIIIYNNFGVAPQKLVATTRFQTPEGLIFRLVNPTTVPGKYTKDGKMLPGSVEAEVVADQSGPTYNVGLKDFTVPGLKTDPAKYKTIYARSKSEMTGGFSGVEKTVTKDVLLKAEKEMEETLKANLSKDVVAQIPGDFVLFQNSLSYKFDPAVTVTTSAGTTVAKKKGVVSAIIFDKKALTKAVLVKVLPDANPDIIKITNLDSLAFNFATSTPLGSSLSTINFSLKGEANFVWVIDEARLKNDLLGLSKSNANTIMTAYPSIKEAWVLTRPFWNTKIPSDPKKVTIINNLEK